MVAHRRALHKYTRAKLPADYVEIVSLENDVVCVLKEKKSKFLCVIDGGELEWRSLDPNHVFVKQFRERNAETYSGIPIVDVTNWVKHDFVPEK